MAMFYVAISCFHFLIAGQDRKSCTSSKTVMKCKIAQNRSLGS